MNINNHTYQVSWSEDDQEFLAMVAEVPSLSWLFSNQQEAEAGLRNLVAEVFDDMKQTGEQIPTSVGRNL
ncbi:MAG: antitoxin HicB [Corynebacterium glutamicum]|nr:antitoxin HicB [Corynebacterium glutamicum]